MPPRVAILPPVPVPYREPLFRALAERGNVIPHVVYLAARQPGWDQPESWFSDAEGYFGEKRLGFGGVAEIDVRALQSGVRGSGHAAGALRSPSRGGSDGRSHGSGRTAW